MRFPTGIFRLPLSAKLLALLCCALLAAAGGLPAQTASQVYAQGVEALNRGDLEGAQQKLQQALLIDASFRPASALLARLAAERTHAGAAVPGLSSRALERTVLPVEFSHTTLSGALEFIRQKAAEQSGGTLQINFALNLPPEDLNKRITLKMDHVPVLEVLRYIGEQAGVQFEKQQYAIAVSPAGGAGAAPSPGPKS